MSRKLYISVISVLISNQVQPQLLPRLCTADSRSSMSIQQVDDDWNPVPFDCENTHVLVVSDQLIVEHLPGKYDYCPANRYRNTSHSDRMSGPVFVLNDNPGTYQVTITRFDEVSTFKNVLIAIGEDGCHTIGQTLEVQFDLSKQAKK